MLFKKHIFLILIVTMINFNIHVHSFFIEQEETDLMRASQQGDLNAMKKYIQSGADVNAVAGRFQPCGGKPVLRYAIDSGKVEAVKLLLDAGATPNDFTESNLITDETDNKENVRNLSLLSHAINAKAPIAIIQLLIDYGANLDGEPKIWCGWTPLMIATYRGYTAAIKILLLAGAEISRVNTQSGKTALDYAKEQNHTEIIQLCAAHAAKIT